MSKTMNKLEILRAQEFRGHRFTIKHRGGEIHGFGCDSVGLVYTNKLETVLNQIMYETRHDKDAEDLVKPEPLDDRYCDDDYKITVTGNPSIHEGDIDLYLDYYSAREIEEHLETYGFCLHDKLLITSIGDGFPPELFGINRPNLVKNLLLTANTLGKLRSYMNLIELHQQDMIDAGLKCDIDLEKIPDAYAGRADLVEDFARMIVRDCDTFNLAGRFDNIDQFIDYGKYWREVLQYDYLHDEDSGYFFNADW